MGTVMLGGGLAAMSLAHELKQGPITILEKEDRPGGLARSFPFQGIYHDAGPHIVFSRDQAVLSFMHELMGAGRQQIRRSNRIFHDGRFIKYPLENDLGSLSPSDRDHCLRTFLKNPYEELPATNMAGFFLKTFGEGLSNLYLLPYNKKIWKFEPVMMDLQMVERIPKPPREDVVKGARGEATEGYTHQLYFSYPAQGGLNTFLGAYQERIKDKAEILTSHAVTKVLPLSGGRFRVEAGGQTLEADRLINCMPLHELLPALPEVPPDVAQAWGRLKYNSIAIVMLDVAKEFVGDNYAVMIADPSCITHRISKLSFLGPGYAVEGGTVLMAEVTYPPDGDVGTMTDDALAARVAQDLGRAGLIDAASVRASTVRRFPYAYVIYDLTHRQNTDKVLGWLRSIGIRCNGRFATFEYLNMDQIIGASMKLARELNEEHS